MESISCFDHIILWDNNGHFYFRGTYHFTGIFSRRNRSNIRAATPGLEAMPEPMIETFASPISKSAKLNPSDNLLSSNTRNASANSSFKIENDTVGFNPSIMAWTIISTLIRFSARTVNMSANEALEKHHTLLLNE